MEITPEHRYYLGRHKIGIISKCYKKALIVHLEIGYVGNKEVGYKTVVIGNHDIVPMRMLWRGKK